MTPFSGVRRNRDGHAERRQEVDRVPVVEMDVVVEVPVHPVGVVPADGVLVRAGDLHLLDHARDLGDVRGTEAVDESGEERTMGLVEGAAVRVQDRHELAQLVGPVVVARAIHVPEVPAGEVGLPRLPVPDERAVAQAGHELGELRRRERDAGDQLVRDLGPQRAPVELGRRVGERLDEGVERSPELPHGFGDAGDLRRGYGHRRVAKTPRGDLQVAREVAKPLGPPPKLRGVEDDTPAESAGTGPHGSTFSTVARCSSASFWSAAFRSAIWRMTSAAALSSRPA